MIPSFLFIGLGGLLGGVGVFLWRNATIAALRGQMVQKELQHQSEITNLKAAYDLRIQDMQLTEKKLETTFKAVASTVLEQEAKQYEASAKKDLTQITTAAEGKMELSKQAIESIVKGLTDQLKSANEKITQFETDRTVKYAQLEKQIEGLSAQEQKLIEETQHLKSALTTSGAVRGRWGELVLRNILQMSDLREGTDYTIQTTSLDDEGRRLRPDCIIKLPHSSRSLAIDAKASLYESYLAADNAKTDDERKVLHKEFCTKLRDRVKDLTKREYKEFVPDSVPYVVIFVPSEAAMRAALECDQELLQDCAAQKVIVTSPATLMPLIWLIADAWRQHRIATQAQALSIEVKELGRRLENFVQRLIGVHKGLEFASKSWNEAVGKSWLGQKSVTRSLEKVKDMGNLLPELPELPEMVTELIAPPKLVTETLPAGTPEDQIQ